MTETEDNRFIHSMSARFLALLIGIAILALIVVTWGEDMKKLAASFTDGKELVLVQPVGEERVKDENPALAACLDERIGDVNQMRDEGVINEEQYQQFSARARALCQAQNPG